MCIYIYIHLVFIQEVFLENFLNKKTNQVLSDRPVDNGIRQVRYEFCLSIFGRPFGTRPYFVFFFISSK